MGAVHNLSKGKILSKKRRVLVRKPVRAVAKAVPAKNSIKEIAALKKLLDTISRGKYMWESTFDAINDPVMIVSSDYVIQRANRAAANVAEIDVRKMIHKTCYQVLAGLSSPCSACPLQETLSTHTPCSCDLLPFSKERGQYHANAYPLTSEGFKNQAVLYYRNITEEKELQRKLVHSEKMAAIGTLAGGVAHEINNPLGGILAFTQLVLRDLDETHPNHSDLKQIEEATLRCKKIVQDLLDFSRQNREEVMGPVNINDVVKKVLPLVQLQTKTHPIKINCEFTENLPSINGHHHKLQQVFLNLIANGCQAMLKGGTLTIKTFSYGGEVCAQITDTGMGISRKNMGRIFDPYFTTKDQGHGTGLGLSITYGIVQEHQGTIKVVSTEGQGSTFTLQFPSLESTDRA